MKLIETIVTELIDINTPLTAPLLKTKVLAVRIKHTELHTWVNNELNGYSESHVIPEYRKQSTGIVGTIINGNYRYTNHNLSTYGLSEKIAYSLNYYDFKESISVLESLMNAENPTRRLEIAIPPEIISYMEQVICSNGNPFFHIANAHRELPLDYISQILAAIRSKLLDFMLKLEEEFGTETEIKLSDNQKISNIMNNTIINTGDGNVVNTGNNNELNINIDIKKGDKESLRKYLENSKVNTDDINELIEVIDENPSATSNQYNDRVKLWINKMIAKAVDGSWQVGIGAAGTLIAEAFKSYYGM